MEVVAVGVIVAVWVVVWRRGRKRRTSYVHPRTMERMWREMDRGDEEPRALRRLP